jgi:hypothetical protein
LEFAARYTNVDTLRQTFGTNKNKLWGDFDPHTTRKLYHVLLPRVMLELYKMGYCQEPQELAPLAYEARVAAKKYARERCIVPGRILSMAYDGFRSWKNYGTWNAEGLSWEQIWYKYEEQVLQSNPNTEHVQHQVCLKILEKSCASNPLVDRLCFHNLSLAEQDDIARIAQQLDDEMQEILRGSQRNNKIENGPPPQDSKSLKPPMVATLRFLLQTKKQLLQQRPPTQKIWETPPLPQRQQQFNQRS